MRKDGGTEHHQDTTYKYESATKGEREEEAEVEGEGVEEVGGSGEVVAMAVEGV